MLLPLIAAACEGPFGLGPGDIPFITVERPVFELEPESELVTLYTVSNPSAQRFYLRIECGIDLDRLGPDGWESVWSPDGCSPNSQRWIVLEPGSDLVGLFAASRPGGWIGGVYRLRFSQLEVVGREGGSGRLALPEEWRVSERFEIRR